jgi:hypothetical protein
MLADIITEQLEKNILIVWLLKKLTHQCQSFVLGLKHTKQPKEILMVLYGWVDKICKGFSMKFNEWVTAYSAFKKLAGAPPFKHWQDFYAHALTVATAEGRQVAINQFKTESNWLKSDRCYYSVWPKIIPMLIRLNLKKIDASWMKLPLPELCIRLPERDNPLSFDFQGTEHHIRCMLLSEASVNKTRGVCLWLDIGEVEHGLPVYSFYSFRCLENRPLQDEIDGLPKKKGMI